MIVPMKTVCHAIVVGDLTQLFSIRPTPNSIIGDALTMELELELDERTQTNNCTASMEYETNETHRLDSTLRTSHGFGLVSEHINQVEKITCRHERE